MKVGDRVRVIGGDDEHGLGGLRGVVTHESDFEDFEWAVELDLSPYQPLEAHFYESELEVI